VAEQFSDLGVGRFESLVLVNVFPELAAVVKEHAGQEQIPVQRGINPADRVGGSHHLGDVFHQSAPPCMVVVARRRRSPEPLAEPVQVELAQAAHPGIVQTPHKISDGDIILRLPAPQIFRSAEHGFDLLSAECLDRCVARFDAEISLGPGSAHRDKIPANEPTEDRIERRVFPGPEDEVVSGVRQLRFQEGLSSLRGPLGESLQLGVNLERLRLCLGPLLELLN